MKEDWTSFLPFFGSIDHANGNQIFLFLSMQKTTKKNLNHDAISLTMYLFSAVSSVHS